jgi:hypothetical protein
MAREKPASGRDDLLTAGHGEFSAAPIVRLL